MSESELPTYEYLVMAAMTAGQTVSHMLTDLATESDPMMRAEGVRLAELVIQGGQIFAQLAHAAAVKSQLG